MRKHQEQDAVRGYLLKQLPDAERQEIELRLLSDDSFFPELEIGEDELIDDYLANELSRAERVRFEENFLTSPERLSKLRSAQAMKRYLGPFTPAPPQKSRILERLYRWFGLVFPVGFSSPTGTGEGSIHLTRVFNKSIMAITVAVAVAVGLLVWRGLLYRSDLEKGLIALNDAYRQERPVEARVSKLDYAPFLTKRNNGAPPVNALELSRAQRFLLDAEKEQADASSYHALGKLYLLQRQPDKAIEYLERAAHGDPQNAQILADLGAAYLEKGKLELESSKFDATEAGRGKGLEDLGRSLEYLKRALELDPDQREALFNRGLVHHHQGLNQAAEADWRAYLEKDSISQWAVEARNNLKRLEDQKNRRSQNAGDRFDNFMRAYRARDDTAAWEIYRLSYADAGNYVSKALLDRLLAENIPVKTTENLQALTYLGQIEILEAQDAYTSDLAKVYASTTPQTQALLIQARQEVVKAFELLGKSRIGEASELFMSARNTFEKVGDFPEALTAEAAMAHGAVLQPDLAKGQELLASVIPACESKRYKRLFAQTLYYRAHIQSNFNNYSEAISDGSRALQLFEELKDESSTLRSLSQLANLHLFLNDNEISLSFLRRAMVIVEQHGVAPNLLWPLHIAVSLNLSALQLYRAALDYQNEALQLVLPSGAPLLLSRSYQFIGLTYGSLRQFDLALENVHRAYEQGQALASERNGQNMMANASLKLGDLHRLSGNQTKALAAYNESSRLYAALGFDHYSYAAHKGKFLSYLAQNNDAMTSQELSVVLGLFDGYRKEILEERQKSFFFDREQDIYDLAIDFAYSRLGDQRRAFDYSETCRARNLSELMRRGAEVTLSASGLDLRSSKAAGAASTASLSLSEIQRQLPEQVQIVQYAVLEKKLLVWHFTTSSFFTRSIEIESSKLTKAVSTSLKQIRQRDENGATNSLQSLYELLIEPIRGQLNPKLVLCFIPDKILHYVPFNALRSASSGRYLMQDYRVMTSPSATILVDSSNRARGLAAAKDERLLAVGNPTFERTTNSDLASLPGAEREVEEIALSYPVRRVLVERQATRKSVTEELARADIAHFAAHYQIDPRSKLSSKLLLSPGPGERAHSQSSGLNSGDIYQMKLARTKLVILSGCQTGIEQQLAGEGAIGFARSFLVAGVPVVVASLWPVDSDATSELMIAFHRFRRRQNLSTAEALMRAQQEIMARENYRSPYFWAGFTATGGYSDF